MNSEPKSMFQSKGVIGGAIAFFAGLLPLIGIHVTPELVTETTMLTTSLISVISGFVAVWGRIVATQPIE